MLLCMVSNANSIDGFYNEKEDIFSAFVPVDRYFILIFAANPFTFMHTEQ